MYMKNNQYYNANSVVKVKTVLLKLYLKTGSLTDILLSITCSSKIPYTGETALATPWIKRPSVIYDHIFVCPKPFPYANWHCINRGVNRPKFGILKNFAGGPGQRPGGGTGGEAPGSSWSLREIKAQYAISWNSFKCYVLCKSKIRCTNIFQEWFIMWSFGMIHVIFPLDLHVYTSLAVYL